MRYKINLKPLDWFFFGGEHTFNNGENESYIARSNHMPQQTTLLGMVRYQLLKQKGLLYSGDKDCDSQKKTDINTIIGTSSFDIEADKSQSFGAIKSLSPVFIQKGERQLVPMPLTYGVNVDFLSSKVWMNGKQCTRIVNAPSFNEKTYGNFSKYIDKDNNSCDIEDIFILSMQVGITKSTGGDVNEKGFYKQEVIRFRDLDTSFCFYLDLEDDATLEDDIVFIGAQRSCFKMKVQPLNESLFIPEHPAGSILICSPSYVKDINALNEICLQHWSGTISFRNIKMDDKGKLKSGAISYSRHSSLCTFLSAGSVIFYDGDEQKSDIEKLLNNENLINIGYNHYSIK